MDIYISETGGHELFLLTNGIFFLIKILQEELMICKPYVLQSEKIPCTITLCILMDSSFLIDTIRLGQSIVHI